MSPRGVYDRKDSLEPQAEEIISPSAISTPKESQQDDTIRVLQKQIAELTQAIGQISKQTGSTVRLTERTGDAFGFLRAINGKPVIGWKTEPGSYATINSFGQEVDEQYLRVHFADDTWSEKMHYREFSEQTKINQIPIKIPNYCEKNDLGEWKPKRHKPMDEIEVILSEDGGVTFNGLNLPVPCYALN